MKWIDTYDIEKLWAGRRDCQESLPLLVRKLIRATTQSINNINFPAGESIAHGGWDGILNISEENEYIPIGTSLWEFGSSKDPKTKAESDYSKRTTNPLGFDPTDSTFIFVTPRLWQNRAEWIEEKKKEGIWKDICVINSENLEEWIETAPTVGSWLSKHIGKYPDGGIQPTDDFWEEWVSGPKIKLNQNILLGGRDKEKDKILTLSKNSSITIVEGLSREESLAFIVACFIDCPEQEEDFFSRSIIVDNQETFRKLAIHTNPLILIPRFDDEGVVNRAVHKGHTVIIPIGIESSGLSSDKISLPSIERESFVKSLCESGLSKEIAENYSKESARNISILRRQLEFSRTIPPWAKNENVGDLIPALIVGRWDENYENDRNIVSNLFGEDYENYAEILNRWLHTHDSPIIKIGSIWRLTSPFDAWMNASRYLTKEDFEKLHKSLNAILSEINPAFELESDNRHMAGLLGKRREYSTWIREGIVQSLILTSIFGDKLNFDLPVSASSWVDHIVNEVLKNKDPLYWKSIEGLFPLISEASPKSFLSSVEIGLDPDQSHISSLFEEDSGVIAPQSYHTGLLWALEGLAWFPEYFARVSMIFAQLAVIDPGGNLQNRPINSLSEIFKSWHYQTLASFDERMQVLELISKNTPQTAWQILIRMLPASTRDSAFPTHKTRWRMFEIETEKPVSWNEIYKTYSSVVDLIFKIYDYSELKLASLVEASVNLLPSDRENILKFIGDVSSKVDHDKHLTWHALRKVLHHHRSYPDTDWALPESILKSYEAICTKLEPKDTIGKVEWLFNEHWPSFPDGIMIKKESYAKQEEFIRNHRIEGLTSVYEEYDLKKIIELSTTVEESWILGDILGNIKIENDETLLLCESLKSDEDNRFIKSFLFRKGIILGIKWVTEIYDKLESLGFDEDSLARLFIPLDQSQVLWDFIESKSEKIIKGYWSNVYPHFNRLSSEEKAFGIGKLIENNRFSSAIHTCSFYIEEIPSILIVSMLHGAATEKTDENIQMIGSDFNRVFEELDSRKDIDHSTLVQLEWLFLPVLSSYGNRNKPKRLHNELSNSPEFFIEVLSLNYKSENEDEEDVDQTNLSIEQVQSRALFAYQLLNSWDTIPGVSEKGEIDFVLLESWVEKSREMAEKEGRLNPADIHIGQMLSKYPETPEQSWPPKEICNVIQKLNSDTINRNFSTATFNKRGGSTRGAFDGGDIERGHSEYFYKLAEKHRREFPVVARILENLAKSYSEDAKRMDEEAERRKLEH